MTSTPQELIRPEIRALSAYHVPDARGLIKLDAMENPYVWPEDMTAEWLEMIRDAPLNRYPDPGAAKLKERLREVMDIPAGTGLILGNGSDELIQLIALAVATPGRAILAPEPSFVMYRMIAVFAGMEFVGVPLRAPDFALDPAAMQEAMARHRPVVVFLAYPNNPTGNRFDEQDVREIIAAAPGLVVVDEAYFPFADHSFMDSVPARDNLLVMRTVSKLGLAGLRLGLLVGADHWINEFEKLRLPYNINILTQLSAEFALSHWSVLEEQARRIRADRSVLLTELNKMKGITAYSSEANFVLFQTPAGAAERLHGALRQAGVLVKNLSGGVLRDCLRVTVGTAPENRAFLSALAAAL
jgi:histidinol-phosphate aminotransferase